MDWDLRELAAAPCCIYPVADGGGFLEVDGRGEVGFENCNCNGCVHHRRVRVRVVVEEGGGWTGEKGLKN